ncbi:MAG: LysR family transcriptional regulator [Luteibacter sp.]
MDRLLSMAVFVKCAEVGTFAGAADSLGMSPQMVAKHVGFLEDRLGTRLINRTTRRQSLTEIGLTYLDRCRAVLADVEAAEAIALEVATEPRGRLRVNAPMSFGTEALVPMITAFRRQFPKVEIDLTLGDRMVDLIDDGYDVVFRIGPLADSGLKARALAPFRVVACAAPEYIALHGNPQTPDELREHECIGYGTYPFTDQHTWRFVRDGETASVSIRTRLSINDARAILKAALQGHGIALLAEDLVREPMADGRLVRVLPEFESPPRPMHVLFAADSRPTATLRQFIEAVAVAFG